MMKYLLFVVCILTSYAANSDSIDRKSSSILFDFENIEYAFKFGGWSKHTNSLTKDIIRKHIDENFTFNESHEGFGIDAAIPFKDTNHFITSGLWYMKDSFDKDAFHAGIGYRYRFNTDMKALKSLDFNIALTYMNRSALNVHTSYIGVIGTDLNGTQSESTVLNKQIEIIRKSFFAPTPYVTFNLSERINIDAMALIMPVSYWDLSENNQRISIKKLETTFFIRAGITF